MFSGTSEIAVLCDGLIPPTPRSLPAISTRDLYPRSLPAISTRDLYPRSLPATRFGPLNCLDLIYVLVQEVFELRNVNLVINNLA